MKIKPILPTLKEKKRYLAYEIITEKETSRDLSSDMISSLKKILGVFDASSAGIIGVEYDSKKSKGILKVSTKSVDKVRSAMIMISKLMNLDVLVHVIGMSGTLKQVRSKYMEV